MSLVGLSLIGAGISAITSIIGAGAQRRSQREAQEEAKQLAERDRKMYELANRRKFIHQQQQNVLQEQGLDLQRAGMAEEKQFRQQQQAIQLNRQQVQDTLGMINQSSVMRNQFRNVLGQ